MTPRSRIILDRGLRQLCRFTKGTTMTMLLTPRAHSHDGDETLDERVLIFLRATAYKFGTITRGVDVDDPCEVYSALCRLHEAGEVKLAFLPDGQPVYSAVK
jgi:hypothetical protein